MGERIPERSDGYLVNIFVLTGRAGEKWKERKVKAVILEGSSVNPGDISWEPVTGLCDTVVYENTSDAEKWERIGDCEIVIINKVHMTKEVFERFPWIRYVGVCATGYNVVDVDAAREHGVVVTNIPAYSTESVMQFTWAYILGLASRIQLHNESVKNGDWIRSTNFCYWKESPTELAGKTLGVYGYGNIGRKVARAAEVFGMKALVHTLHPEKYTDDQNDNLRFVTQDQLFENSDVITIHCPLTPATTGIINGESISGMKDGVIIVNLSRGPVVNETDLAEALRSGKVAAFGADVISEEPMKADNPLCTAPNCYLTPHIAWATREARERLVDIAAANLKAFLEGKPINVVSG